MPAKQKKKVRWPSERRLTSIREFEPPLFEKALKIEGRVDFNVNKKRFNRALRLRKKFKHFKKLSLERGEVTADFYKGMDLRVIQRPETIKAPVLISFLRYCQKTFSQWLTPAASPKPLKVSNSTN